MSTPVTASLKVTRKVTLVELVVSDTGLFLLMLLTDGEAVSHAARSFRWRPPPWRCPPCRQSSRFRRGICNLYTRGPRRAHIGHRQYNRVTCPGTGRAYRVGIRCAGFGHRETAVVCF
jgi:hypothetical protein